MDQKEVQVLSLSREETDNLKDGVNLINVSENEKYVIFKEPGTENYRACLNKCKHQGGTFISDIEDASKW